jgi:hypothetical protein
LQSLTNSLEAYIRVNQTANKKLRKRYGQLKQDAQLKSKDAIQDRPDVSSIKLSDKQDAEIVAALADFVKRQQLESRVIVRDSDLFERLDKTLEEPLKVEFVLFFFSFLVVINCVVVCERSCAVSKKSAFRRH